MPKGCGFYRGQFAPYIGGGLPQEERRELARHLRGCPECAEAFGLEWRTFLGSPMPKERDEESPAPATRFLGGRVGRLLVLLVPLLVLGLLFLASLKGPVARSEPEAGPELQGATARLLQAQTQLLDSLVAVARQRQAPVSREAQFSALCLLEQAGRALERADVEALRPLLHPRFRLAAWTLGGLVERSMDREQVLREPSLAAELLALEGRSEVRWWSAEEESVTLFLAGREGAEPVLLVLLRDQGSLRLFWAQVSSRSDG